MQRLTATQAAQSLGVEEPVFVGLANQHRNELPGYDPDDLENVPVEVVEKLREIHARSASPAVTPQDGVGRQPQQTRDTDSQPKPKGAKIVAVTSGKGGVGKTSICVNLAAELSQRGLRTILVDVDLGLANAHILAGLKPGMTLSDYLEGRATLANIVIDGPSGVKLISGGSGIEGMANLDEAGRRQILDAVESLKPHCDLIMLDTGAGVSRAVTDFVSITDHTIVVTTSNFAAIADAYGIVKILVQDGFDRAMHLIINRVRSPEEAEQVFKKMQGCTQRFLNFDLNWLGLLPEDHSVEGAVLQRTPFREAYPSSVASGYLKKLASALERYLEIAPTATVG